MPGINIDVILSGEQAVTEAAKVDKSLDSIGKAGKQSGAEAAAGLNNIERAARSSSASVSTAGQAAARYSKEILEARAELAQMGSKLRDVTQQFGQKSAAATDLKSKMTGLATSIRQMVAEQAILVAESKVEKQAVEASTSAFSRKTNMVNTGQGALRGYDAIIQSVVRSFGGITILWAVAIQLGSALLPLLFNITGAEKEKLAVDKEMIAADLARADAQTRAIRTNADLISSMIVVSREQADYQKNTRELKDALSVLEAQGQRTRVMHGRLSEGTVLITANTQALQSEVGTLNTALDKQEKELLPAIAAIVAYRDATGKSTDEVIRAIEKTGRFAAESLPFLREQLNATTPFVNDLTDALAKLRVPQFNLGATPQGIAELERSVLSGLSATFDKGIGGSATKANDFNAQVRALAPTLRTLDENLKRNSGSVAEYNRQLSELNPVVRNALETFQRQEKAYKENFDTRKKQTVDILSLEKEATMAGIKAAKEGLDQKEALIKAEFVFRKQELEKNGQLTQVALNFLRIIEMRQLTEVTNDRIKLYQKEQADRRKLIEEGHETRLRLEREFFEKERKLIIQQGRETRIQLEAEDRAFRERRTGREGRRETQADEIGRQARDLDRVNRAFGRASRSAEIYRQQIAFLNGELSNSQAITLAFRATLEQFTDDWIRSGEIFQRVGDGISDALQGVIANGEDFGAAMKAMLLNLIADMAGYWGQYFIALGAGMLWTNPAAGAGLIAAGVALLALAGVLRGFASKIQQGASQSASGGGSAASGGGGSTATGGGSSAFTGERSKLSPGPEFSGSARVAEIDRRIANLDSLADRTGGVFERAFRRQIELLEAERRALLSVTASVVREASRPLRIPVNASGPGSAPVFVLHLDSSETAQVVVRALESNGVVTVRSAGGRHRRQLKKKMR